MVSRIYKIPIKKGKSMLYHNILATIRQLITIHSRKQQISNSDRNNANFIVITEAVFFGSV
jgi:hypothetical protein